MPLDLSDALYQQLLDRFPADRDYPRTALYVEGMPPLVADLLGRTLDRWLEHELDDLESRWFDFDDPAVRAARAELIVALSRTARVPRGAWTETLRYAVGLVVRHLVDPARALTDATFEGEDEELPAATVRARLRTFKAYEYLPEIADAYVAERRLETVDPDTLHGLLLRIDRRVTSDYGVDDWLRLLGPLFKLARRLPDLKGVPAPLLEQFFAAKGRPEIARALSEMGDRVVDEQRLHEVIASEMEPKAIEDEEPSEPSVDAPDLPAESEPDDAESPVQEAAVVPEEEIDSVDEEEHIEEDEGEETVEETVSRGAIAERASETPSVMPAPPDEPEPLWKRFAEGARGPTVETSVPADPAPQAEEKAFAEPEDTDHEAPLWKRFFGGLRRGEPDEPSHEPAEAEEQTASLEDLEDQLLDGITARQRRTYVRDLFRGDEAAYETVLRKLASTDTWSAASQIIAREVFRRHSVDIYSETAVSFTDRVEKAFRS